MKLLNLTKKYGMGLLSFVLVLLAAAFGADCSFAMAVDPVELAKEPNPSGNMNPVSESNPEGRPAGEALQPDEHGGRTQLQGHAATATDVRDAGLEAEDYDEDVVNFRKFRFPIETYILNRCRPVKSQSYEHGHYRSASTNLEATYNGADITITAGADTSISISTVSTKVFDNKTHILTLPASLFENPECLMRCSTVAVNGAEGYSRDEDGSEVADGELMLFVLDNNKDTGNIKFLALNYPFNTTGTASTSKIASGTTFFACATAGSESQIRVDSETYLPEKYMSYLQKKIVTCIITDEFDEQDKKTGVNKKDVLANAMYNFKRKCARSHWLGTQGKTQIDVKETGNREYVYFEKGIMRQIPMLYTHGDELKDDDLMAITALQFTQNSVSDSATAFCGRRAIQRLMKLVNSAQHFKDIKTVTVNDYGIRVRKWEDNFGEIEFVYDPTLDDIGYEDFMVVVDLKNAVRYYKKNEKDTTQDMSKSGESREAKAYNRCVIDCVALKGYNAVLVCPSSLAQKASKLGGIQADFVSVAELPKDTALTAAAKLKRYYLTADCEGFQKGTVVEWDSELGDWKEFEGILRG